MSLQLEPAILKLGKDAGLHVFGESVEVLLLLSQNAGRFLKEGGSGNGVQKRAKGIDLIFNRTA
jgi:hypothetical protein